MKRNSSRARALPKSPTGIRGLDDVTDGGLPKGRPTLVAGAAGCGKTLLAMEFLINGAQLFGEPGIFVSFEETADDLRANFTSFGVDLDELEKRRLLMIDHISIDRNEFEETGEFDLGGLFVRLDHALRTTKARRVVLDTIEVLFSGFNNTSILRSEIQRLFRWLKSKKVTAIVTAERSDERLTRQGLEEFVSDCVIVLDHRMVDQISTRRLSVVKYRGSAHGTNEYPFLIDAEGISVLPITSVGGEIRVSLARVSSGIPSLDAMLGGKGFYKGSSVLVTGTPGSGKTNLAGHFANAICQSGKKALFAAFEEPREQVLRNLQSIGLNLGTCVRSGQLEFYAARSTIYGLEMHLARLQKMVDDFRPDAVVIDPITNFTNVGTVEQVKSMLMRIVDLLRMRAVTCLLTALVSGESMNQADLGVSSLVDTWIQLRDGESGGERTREMLVLKSRGMSHSRRIRPFDITSKGIILRDSTEALRPSDPLQKSTRNREHVWQ